VARPREPRRSYRLAVALLCAGLTISLAAPAQARSKGPTADIVDTARGTGKVLSLTFDDGPGPVDTPRLLSVLRQHRVKAVFCLWGDHVLRYPEIVRRIVAEGHVLCNHTMHHDDMGDWTPERIRTDLLETNRVINRVVPGAPVPYFRAPYGSWGRTPEVAARLGMQPLGWRLEVEDWVPPGTDELVRRIITGLTPGAVVLLHDGAGDRSQTVEAVERIIPRLKREGWRFTLPAHPGC
jgi:peptidoglycan/xylan/chitin deacetylase (PgdA/CDA1 family)